MWAAWLAVAIGCFMVGVLVGREEQRRLDAIGREYVDDA